MNRKQYRQTQRALVLFAESMELRKSIKQTLESIAEVRKIRQQNHISFVNLPNTRSYEVRYAEVKEQYKQALNKLHHLIHAKNEKLPTAQI